MKKLVMIPSLFLWVLVTNAQETSWIRINQLGYTPSGTKVAVWGSKAAEVLSTFELVDVATNKAVFAHSAGQRFGTYGPFTETYRLDFSSFAKPGMYFLRAGTARSPVFPINAEVYKGTADFCLRYMRQQRSGFNPFLKDSCHTHDGYTLYGPMPDSTHIDVSGGWHDASDYLQYSTTSANATWHLLAAYRDFPKVFGDEKSANGLDGRNGLPDIVDEANWGIDWLLKMFPNRSWMFNQLGDDRDHMGMRIPKEDSFYGRGYERPVYFVSGKPQQRGKFMNNTTGVSSTAGKFASVFSLAHTLYETDSIFRRGSKKGGYYDKAYDAFNFALANPGVSQTASVRSPYIYAEENWTDDMELAASSIHEMTLHKKGVAHNGFYLEKGLDYARQEKITPWLGADTARHYQWYPFINAGHYELIKQLQPGQWGSESDHKETFRHNSDSLTNYYREGIEKVWNKARTNAFYRGIPFIWCSNNLTTSFAIQCYWYRQVSGDDRFAQLEQANLDWLFGCNPWGTGMVYGLPANGDTPVDPHSAFTHLKNYPIDGGLVDGPVYTSIYKGLIGIQLKDADEYAPFQSELAVYHDDYGDYSSNEPTMDGTASLIYLLAAKENETRGRAAVSAARDASAVMPHRQYVQGATIRGDSTVKQMALVFTGDEFGEGLPAITRSLKANKIQGSFFFTGRFYRNAAFQPFIRDLVSDKQYLGPHSDQHLLYCDWNKRDSLLVSREQFTTDLSANLNSMQAIGIQAPVRYFIPPYEWWNSTIASWSGEVGMQLFSFTPGTTSNADYTYPELGRQYKRSEDIIRAIKNFHETRPAGLNGVILLVHAGTDPRRKDKLYNRLDELIGYLKKEGYGFVRVDELLR